MNDQNQNAVIPQPVQQSPARQRMVVQDDSAIAYLMDTARFEHLYRIATTMARASLIPKHLIGKTQDETVANCFLVVNQAIRWGFDPFAVAPETYSVGGKLGFQGKLVAAVINVRAGLKRSLWYTFNDKTGDALEVTVHGHIEGEEEERTVTMTVAQGRTDNAIWTKDPHQKLIYSGAIKWGRRHTPEVVMGVLTDDDLDAAREEARAIAAKPIRPSFVGAPSQMTEIPSDVAAPAQPAPPAPPEPPTAQGEPESTKTPGTPSQPQDGSKSEPVKQPAPGAKAEFKPNPAESAELTQLRLNMHNSDITEAKMLGYAHQYVLLKPEQTGLGQMHTSKIKGLNTSWPTIATLIKQG